MRILFCCNYLLDPLKGVPKHYLELAAAFRDQSWEAAVVGRDTIARDTIAHGSALPAPDAIGPFLRAYLRREAGNWDVVQYDHAVLPYPRSEFAAGTLMVAMSTLLAHNLATAPIPPRPRLRSRIGHFLFARQRRRQTRELIERADETFRQADRGVVLTDRDAAVLAARGHDPRKLLIFPLGITAARRPLFDAVSASVPPGPPRVAFVGTFDPRKGMCEFPELVARVRDRFPEVRFRLMGTEGMVPDAAGVLGYFPRRLRPRIEVVPRYDADDLPALLADCALGVFPSAVEGFPFGVLEMQAAALPVVAYDATGPHAMLPPDLLVPVRNVRRLTDRVVDLLADPALLAVARQSARERSRQFVWEDIARQTAAAYAGALAEHRARRP